MTDPWGQLLQQTEDPKLRDIIKQCANAYKMSVRGHNQMTQGIAKILQHQYDLLEVLSKPPEPKA